jgi:hypothetical protein
MTKLCELIGRGWLRVALLFALLLLPNTAHADDKISDQAKLYFKNGVDLIQSTPPNYQDAYYQFKLAWDNSHSWKVLGNLGLCAFKLERDGEALQDYQDYLKGGGKQIDAEERKAMERDSLLISGNTSVVRLGSDVADANVLDARAGSSVPPQSYKLDTAGIELRLRAGTHTLTASTPDGKQQRWDVTITPGQTLEHRFEFNAAAPVPAATPVTTPPPATPPPPGPVTLPPTEQSAAKSGGSPLRTVGFVTAGVGGAALIGGVITGIMAKGKSSDATKQCADKVCPTAAAKDFDSASSLATVTDVLLIGGAVLAAAGVTLVIVGGHSGAPAQRASVPRLELTPVVARNGGGLFASGSF